MLNRTHEQVERQQTDRFDIGAPRGRVILRIYDFLELETGLLPDLRRLEACLDRCFRHHAWHVGEANIRDEHVFKILFIYEDIIWM